VEKKVGVGNWFFISRNVDGAENVVDGNYTTTVDFFGRASTKHIVVIV
jgi:hypothetical protein